MRWVVWCVLGMLAGCTGFSPSRPAGPIPVVPATAWDTHRASIAALKQWSLEGRIALQKNQEGGSAGVRWQQDGENFELRISAPFGRGTYRLWGDQTQVALSGPDGKVYRAQDVESLMAAHLQWALPLAGAKYWVVGIPAPTPAPNALRTDDQGRLTDMEQSGWRISVLRYTKADTLELPDKLFLTHGEVQIRMVIAIWKPQLP